MAARIAALKAMAFQGQGGATVMRSLRTRRSRRLRSRVDSPVAWVSALGRQRRRLPRGRAAPIRGFSAAASAAETARERELKAMPSAKAAEADFDVMTAEPHHTGSPYEIKLADYVRRSVQAVRHRRRRSYEYSVLIPWPRRAPRRHRRARPGEAARSRKRRSAAIRGPTSRASCRPTTRTRRRAT